MFQVMDRVPIYDLNGQRSAPFFGDEDFLSDQVLVTVVPSRRFNHDLNLSCGSFGSFRAYTPTQVPLWLARSLARKKLVSIEDPEWLSVEALEAKVAAERSSAAGSLTDLPERFSEISYELLREGDHELVRVALEDLMCLRRGKLISSVAEMSAGTLHLDVSALTSSEIGLLRTGAAGVLDKIGSLFGGKEKA